MNAIRVKKILASSKFGQGQARCEGFTLVELMAVLLIVAAILMVALPGFSTLTQRTILKSYTNDFITSVVLARSEAIKRNSRVDLCVVLDPDDPVACGASGDWEGGWLVRDPNGPVIRYQQALSSDIQLFDISSATFSSLSFDSMGLGSDDREFKMCKPGGVEAKQIRVSRTGRTRVETFQGCACVIGDCSAPP